MVTVFGSNFQNQKAFQLFSNSAFPFVTLHRFNISKLSNSRVNRTDSMMAQTDVTQPGAESQSDVISDKELDVTVRFAPDWDPTRDIDAEDLVRRIAKVYRPRLDDIIQNVDDLSVFDESSISIGDHEAATCGKKLWVLRRVILCMIVQILLTVAVCYYMIKERLRYIGLCKSLLESDLRDVPEDVFYKFSASLMSAVLTLKLGDQMLSRMRKGIYLLCDCDHAALPSFMDDRYVKFGYYFTSISNIMILFAVYIIILCSETVVDVVFNAVALGYIGELHYWMIEKKHYDMLKRQIDAAKRNGNMIWVVHGGYNDRIYKAVRRIGFCMTVIAYIAPVFIFWCH